MHPITVWQRCRMSRENTLLLSLLLAAGWGTPSLAQSVLPSPRPPVLLPPVRMPSPSQIAPPLPRSQPLSGPIPYPSPSQPATAFQTLSLDALIDKLRTADVGERSQIIAALKDRGPAAVPRLTAALDISDPLVCSAAAEALGRLGEAAYPALPALIRRLDDSRRALPPQSYMLYPSPIFSPSPTLLSPQAYSQRPIPTPPDNPRNLIKLYALGAIGQIGNSARATATPPILPLLQDSDPWVRLHAAWALTQLGSEVPVLPVYIAALQDPDLEVREAAAKVLGRENALSQKLLGAEATPATAVELVKVLSDRSDLVRLGAIDALLVLGPDAVPALSAALQHPEPLARLSAAETLGRIGKPAIPAIPALVALLADRDRDSPPPPPNPWNVPLPVAPSFFRSYGGFGQPWPPSNPDRWVRAEAAVAIARIGRIDTPGKQALRSAAVQDENPSMRLRSTWALFVLGDDVSPLLPSLGKNLTSSDSMLREESFDLLQQIGRPAAPLLVNHYLGWLDRPETRTNGILRLGDRRLGSVALVAVPRLRPYLESDDKTLRGYTVTMLANIADEVLTDASYNRLTPAQRQQAIVEFSKALTVVRRPGAGFNQPPVQRIQRVVDRLQKF